MSNFELKRDEALRILDKTGIRKSNYCPPMLRLLWRVGLEAPPPHFARFGPTALVAGVFFAATWGITMWLLVWRDTPMSAAAVLIAAMAAGLFFGLAMAAYYSYGRNVHGLPDWDNLNSSSGA